MKDIKKIKVKKDSTTKLKNLMSKAKPPSILRRVLFRSKWVGVGLVAGVVIATVGSVGALSGWFGGGSVPSDTFTRGLVGYWSLNEGSGSMAYDASGNGNHGILYNNASWSAGKVGGALQFDGVDDYMDTNLNPSTDFGQEITIECWVRPETENDYRGVGGAHISSFQGISFMQYNSGWSGWLNAYGDGSDWVGNTVTTLNMDQWTHIVLTIRGSDYVKLYKNGNLVDSVSVATDIYHYSDFWIGRSFDHSSRYFDGSVDEFRIYNRVLSVEEVRYHYNRGGPVAYWKFDEGSGSTAYDSTNNNNDGTLYGEMATSTLSSSGWTSGKHGSALSFDGVDDYVNISHNSSISLTETITVSAWVKRSDEATGEKRIVIKSGGPYALVINNNKARFAVRESGPGSWYNSGDSITTIGAGAWYHLTGIFNGDVIKIYVNGVEENSYTRSMTLYEGSQPLRIGQADDTNYFAGITDDVRIYSYARTPEEIRLDYNAGFAARFGPLSDCDRDPGSCMSKGLVGYWDFEDGEGNLTSDKSGNGNNGTLTNGPAWAGGIVPLSGGKSGGGAVQFDGTDDRVVVSDDDILSSSSALSLEAWIYPTNVEKGASPQTIIRKNDEYLIRINGTAEDYKIAFFVYTGVWEPRAQWDIAPSNNTWYHILGTWDGSEISLYINGELVNKRSMAGTITPTGNGIGMGGETGAANYYEGKIDEVRIYNRALSAAEVRYHYNRGDPVAYWKLDEGAGSIAYNSTNEGGSISIDGTLMGEMATSTASNSGWTTGKHGGALAFDGVDDYVSVPAVDALDITNEISISAWAKANSLDSSGDGIVYKPNVWGLDIKSDGAIRSAFYTSDNGNLIAYDSDAGEITTNEWFHVAVTYDGANVKIYKNGVRVKSFALTGAIQTSVNNLKIGEEYNSTYNFNGLIDEVRIYNYARTAEQIRQDYNAGLAAYFGPQTDCDRDPGACMTEGLVGHWDFEEGEGGLASDKSGNGNGGTLTNGPSWAGGIVPLSGGKTGGGALSFDGVDEYVDAGEGGGIFDFGTEDFAVETWLKRNRTGVTETVISKWETDFPASYFIRIVSDKISTGHRTEVEGRWYLSSSISLSADVWYHVVVQRNSAVSNYQIFINGIDVTVNSQQQISYDGDISNAHNFYIGSQSGGAEPFDGLIDEVRVYNRALSATEVRYHYNRGRPVAHWKFDEGNGTTVYDATENNNNGTMYWMSTSTNGGWTAGKYGSALSFDGSDDHVIISHSTDLEITDSITISAWVKPNELDRYQRLVQKCYGAPEYGNYCLEFSSANVFRLRLGDGSAFHQFDSVTAPTSGVWYHVVGTYDGSVGKIYINGYLDSQTPSVFSISNISSSLQIGGLSGADSFNGIIDDVRIYNYARSEEQIRQDYNAGLSTHFR